MDSIASVVEGAYSSSVRFRPQKSAEEYSSTLKRENEKVDFRIYRALSFILLEHLEMTMFKTGACRIVSATQF